MISCQAGFGATHQPRLWPELGGFRKVRKHDNPPAFFYDAAPMKLLRYLALAHSRALMVFALSALAMQALVPAGLMVAPTAGHGAQIILCPQTHPLARAAATNAAEELAAMHAAMGHGSMDHAAIGHGPTPPDDPAPASSAASSGHSCAFAGAGALSGLLPDRVDSFAARTIEPSRSPLALQPLGLIQTARVRPPSRAPPALI